MRVKTRARAERVLELAKLDPELNVEEILDSSCWLRNFYRPRNRREVGMKDPEELQKQLQDSVVRAIKNGESGESQKVCTNCFDLLNDRNNSIRASAVRREP